MNLRCQNILTRKCLKNKTTITVTSAISTSPRSASPLKSDEVFSQKSRERCMSKIGKMKSMRPSNVAVTQRAAVLGETFHLYRINDYLFLTDIFPVPLVDIAGSPHLLYTRRSLGMSSHSGQVSFPGGKEDEEDEDIVRTALRLSMINVIVKPIMMLMQGNGGGAWYSYVSNRCLVPDARVVLQ